MILSEVSSSIGIKRKRKRVNFRATRKAEKQRWELPYSRNWKRKTIWVKVPI